MLGAAIAVGRGILPPFIIKAALEIPFHFKFPIAPANGLYLSTAGFENAGNVRTVGMVDESWIGGMDG